MSKPPESLDSQIKQALDDKKELPVDEVAEVPEELQKKFDMWLAHLKRRYPTESEKKLRERAAQLACLNRKERRRVFKQSSPKLPRFMKVPRERD
jgi:hypothetical protein